MKAKKISAAMGVAAVTLLSLGLTAANAEHVFAQTTPATNANTTNEAKLKWKQDKLVMFQNVEHKIENIENGVRMTITSTDADTVKKLQEMKQPEAPQKADAKITMTRTNIENGVQITTTSTDAEVVKKLQDRSKDGKPFMMHFGDKGEKKGMLKKFVKKTLGNNGKNTTSEANQTSQK
jgi:uncharacterized protein (UPF0264 family)